MPKYTLPVVACVGAVLGLLVVIWSEKTVPTQPILFPPPRSPFAHAIAGSGQIEASSQNIAVASPFNEIIKEVFVVEGDAVNEGDPLFQLDTQNFDAQRDVNLANLNAAKIALADKKTQFSFYQRVKNSQAISEQVYQQAYYGLLEAEENVRIAEANLLAIETNLDRSLVRAPIDGEILQVNLHVGEVAPIIPPASLQSTWRTASQGNLILMGAVQPLQVRVDIDEDDAWRFEAGSKAVAFVRGNSRINFPLTYLRTEPYIVPKSSFTGDIAERVDTRVLQILYNFNREKLPVYTGQILDIFVEAKPYEDYEASSSN